jgi:hypothetical protein
MPSSPQTRSLATFPVGQNVYSGSGTYCSAFASRLLDMARCQLVREPINETQGEMVMPSSRATAKIASSTR